MPTNEKHLRGKDGGLGFSRGREATESSPIFMGVMGGSAEMALAMGYARVERSSTVTPFLRTQKAVRFLNQHCSMEGQGSDTIHHHH